MDKDRVFWEIVHRSLLAIAAAIKDRHLAKPHQAPDKKPEPAPHYLPLVTDSPLHAVVEKAMEEQRQTEERLAQLAQQAAEGIVYTVPPEVYR